MDWQEVIGMAGTCLVFLGFFGNNLRYTRLMNAIGSIIFIIYGLLIHAPSVWILNGACAILNIVKLTQMRHRRRVNESKQLLQ